MSDKHFEMLKSDNVRRRNQHYLFSPHFPYDVAKENQMPCLDLKIILPAFLYSTKEESRFTSLIVELQINSHQNSCKTMHLLQENYRNLHNLLTQNTQNCIYLA